MSVGLLPLLAKGGEQSCFRRISLVVLRKSCTSKLLRVVQLIRSRPGRLSPRPPSFSSLDIRADEWPSKRGVCCFRGDVYYSLTHSCRGGKFVNGRMLLMRDRKPSLMRVDVKGLQSDKRGHAER